MLLPLRNRYFGLRHGQSLANLEGIVLSDPAAGVPGYGLSPAGREQVRRGVTACRALGGDVTIWSSDFARARESAEVAREVLGTAPVRLSPRLRERAFGTWEGGPNVAYATVWAEDLLDAGHTRWDVESAAQVLERALGLLRELEEAAPSGGATFLLVSHGDPLQILAAGLQGLGAGQHRSLVPWETGEVRPLIEP